MIISKFMVIYIINSYITVFWLHKGLKNILKVCWVYLISRNYFFNVIFIIQSLWTQKCLHWGFSIIFMNISHFASSIHQMCCVLTRTISIWAINMIANPWLLIFFPIFALFCGILPIIPVDPKLFMIFSIFNKHKQNNFFNENFEMKVKIFSTIHNNYLYTWIIVNVTISAVLRRGWGRLGQSHFNKIMFYWIRSSYCDYELIAS